MPGGKFLELLGYVETLGARVSHMEIIKNDLFVLQP